MEFQKYNSLENVKQKLVNMLIDQGHGNLTFAVTEKIHGSNFGIHIDDKEIRFSRRSDFLGDDEQFNGHQRLAADLKRAAHQVRQLLCTATEIRIFGEICGGSLNGKKKEGAKKIQGEVQYSEDTEFFVFDIMVDGKYIPFSEVQFIIARSEFNLVPVIGILPSLELAVAIPNDTDSVIPAALGYGSPEIGTNVKEGNVIVPYHEVVHLPNGKRLILKNKNTKFKERDNEKPQVVYEPMTHMAESVFANVSEYLNPARLSNVISKELDLTSKDFGRIMGLLMQDALAEHDQDNADLIGSAKEYAGDDWKRVSKMLQKEAQSVTRAYFIENIF